MQSYSLLEAVYSKSDPLDMVDPSLRVQKLAEEFYRSPYGLDEIDKFSKLMCEGDTLLEFSLKEFVMDNLSNFLQMAIGWGIEVGITAPSLGAGAPLAVVAEACNDLIFFGYSAADAISMLTNVGEKVSEIKGIWTEMKESLSVEDTPAKIFEKVRDIVSDIEGYAFDIDLPIEEFVEMIQDLFRKLMVKLSKTTGDMLAIFAPVPGVDLIVQNAIAEFADDLFKVAVDISKKIPKSIQEIMHNTEKMKETFLWVLDTGIKYAKKIMPLEDESKKKQKGFLNKYVNKVKSLSKKVAFPTLALLAHTGGLEKIIDFLEKKAKKGVVKAIELYAKIYPMVMGIGSVLYFLQNQDELESADDEDDEEDDEENSK